jgi:threonine-phosphate decarboxylase
MGVLEKYGHGGDLLTAAEYFGVELSEILDFSANINPLGPPKRVMDVIRNQWGSIIHYPDPDQRKLKRILAERLGIEEAGLLIGNGAAECMALVLLALAPKRVGVVYPCFSEYTQLSSQFGAEEIRAVYAREDRDFKPDVDELCELMEWADLVLIGHPNNPTGVVYTHSEMEKLANAAEAHGTYLVMDEAFLDFLPESSQDTLLGQLGRYPRLILVRSMTKFYAIPGLRLGYSMACPELIAKMKGKQVTWSVNSLALAAGECCLEEQAYEVQTRMLIREQRERLASFISRELGWMVWPGQANFLLVRLPSAFTSTHLQEWLAKRGILIRDCSMYPGLGDQDFRIAVLNQQKNERLLQAFGQYVEVWGKG